MLITLFWARCGWSMSIICHRLSNYLIELLSDCPYKNQREHYKCINCVNHNKKNRWIYLNRTFLTKIIGRTTDTVVKSMWVPVKTMRPVLPETSATCFALEESAYITQVYFKYPLPVKWSVASKRQNCQYNYVIIRNCIMVPAPVSDQRQLTLTFCSLPLLGRRNKGENKG
jgi:hypothetical protein